MTARERRGLPEPSEAVLAGPPEIAHVLLPILAGLAAAVIAALAIRVWLAGTNDPDSMASVLYFDRILAGRQIEVTVLTTPKPLLTVLYGAAWNLSHDWRWLVAGTILVHAIGVAVATRVAVRLGGLPAGAFVAVALISSSQELAEVAQANSLPWALTAWAIAADAVTSRPQRYWLAGAALAVGGMARIETWLIVAGATVALAALAMPAVRSRAPAHWPSASAALPLLLGWLAVPVQLLHDTLATGNPLYWLGLPSAYTLLVTPHLAPMTPLEFAREVVHQLRPIAATVALAAVGALALVLQRRWAILIGLTSLVGGSLLLLASLALRAIFISDRYYEEPILGLQFAAALGVGALVLLAARSVPTSTRRVIAIAGTAAAILVAVSLGQPGPLTPALASSLATRQAASEDLVTILPELRSALEESAYRSPRTVQVGRGVTRVDPSAAAIIVPRPIQRRIAIELGVPLTMLADSQEAFMVRPPAELLSAGQVVFHDRLLDFPVSLFKALEIARPQRLGTARTLVPLVVEPGRYWLIAVRSP